MSWGRNQLGYAWIGCQWGRKQLRAKKYSLSKGVLPAKSGHNLGQKVLNNKFIVFFDKGKNDGGS